MSARKPGHHPYNIGETYRFAGQSAFAAYGNWVVTSVVGDLVRGRSSGTHKGEEPMVSLITPPPTGEYAVLFVASVEPDETEAFFV